MDAVEIISEMNCFGLPRRDTAVVCGKANMRSMKSSMRFG